MNFMYSIKYRFQTWIYSW